MDIGDALALLESGMTQQEAADALGISRNALSKRLSSRGIRLGYNDCSRHKGAEAAFLRKFHDLGYSGRLDYLGGYTNNRGIIRLRCRACGCEFERTPHFISHGGPCECPDCQRRESEASREQRREESETKRERRKVEQSLRRMAREAKREWDRTEALAIDHVCPECGEHFRSECKGKVYCSHECMLKANKRKCRTRRKARKRGGAVVDAEIDLIGLLNRDGLTCHICGEPCDPNDYEITDEGFFIAGNRYPSIDHVVPLAKGGTHSWGNVRVAHRICNSIKNDAMPPTIPSLRP